MELLILLNYVASLPEEEKAKVLDEEFHHQKAITDMMCELMHAKAQGGNMHE